MLRWSADLSDTDVDISLVNGDTSEQSDVAFANELMQFAQAVASRDENSLLEARNRLLEVAGPEVVVDAAAIAGNFQRMVRIADSIGIPIDQSRLPLMNEAAETLNLRRFKSAEATPELTWRGKLLASLIKPLMRKAMKKAALKFSE